MNGLPYYKAYPRDFIEGTIGMPFEVKCAYRVVLDLIYMQGGNLPDDPRYISGLLGCSIRKWKSLRDDLVERGKIQVSGEFLTNYRAEKELETLAKLQETKRENRAGFNKNKDIQKRPSDHTEPEPDTYKDDTNVSSRRSDADQGFDDFWEIWPSKKNKQNARKAWRKLSIDDKRSAYSAVRAGWFDQWQTASRDANPIHASTFLNSRRWEDQASAPKLRPIEGGRSNAKRPIADHFDDCHPEMDCGAYRDTSQPLLPASDGRADSDSCDAGLGDGTVWLFSGTDQRCL